MKSKEIKLFRELIENCIKHGKIPQTDFISIRNLILYHVFFYSIVESGILYSDEDLFYKLEYSILEKNIPGFRLNTSDLAVKIFCPEIYLTVSSFIIKNYQNTPLYFLGGIFFENLLQFNLSANSENFPLLNDLSHIKMHGVFYTPQVIASEFIHGIFSKINPEKLVEIERFNVLDLACGCGIFSVKILECLQKLMESNNLNFSNTQQNYVNDHIHLAMNLKSSTRIKFQLLFNNLAAIDKDEDAVEITRYSLLLYVFSEETQILCFDSFIKICQNLTEIQHEDIFEPYLNKSLEINNRYDLVVSNPPYISYYSRHSKEHDFSEDDMQKMKSKLIFDARRRKSGRINSIMFFIDYAIRVCKPDGYISLIVDMNIHESLFLTIRHWILNRLSLLETRVNICDFPGVNSGQSILYLRKSAATNDAQVEIFDKNINERFLLPQSELQKGSNFFIKKKSPWIQRFETFPKLGSNTRISSGINFGGSSEKFIFNSNLSGDFYKLISPSMMKDIYFLDPGYDQNIFVDFNKNRAELINSSQFKIGKKNVIVLGREERFLEPRIFVRQSASRIIATHVDTPMACPYSIFVINQTSEYELSELLGILNSRLLTRYALETGIIRHGSGKQPQIRKSGLYELPLPLLEDFKKYKSSLREPLQRLLLFDYSDKYRNSRKLKEHLDFIEEIVASMYRVKPGDYCSLT